MSQDEAEKWERRYREGEHPGGGEPSSLLRAWLGRLPRGRALDLACGTGRNALFLAEQGYEVDAVDAAPSALVVGERRARARGLAISWLQADLDAYPVPANTYAVVVVCHYINRALSPSLARALKPGGVLLYEHHLETLEPGAGPRRPEHRVKPGELPALFPSLRVLHYEEGVFQEGGRRLALARLVAAREA